MTDFTHLNVECSNLDMWSQFEQFPEMAVRKNRSRPIPGFIFQVTGLHPTTNYEMSVKLCVYDNKKYKYGPVDEDGVQTNKWHPISDNETAHPFQQIAHHWGSRTGEFWMEKGVEFLKVFLCNIPNEDSFLVEPKRVYTASLVIVNTETGEMVEIQKDFHKFVAVSTHGKHYNKPEERLPRAHTNPPVLEQRTPSKAGPFNTPIDRGTKRRQDRDSSPSANGSQKKKQNVQ